MILGVDVSRLQGTPPWAALASAGISFAYVRCGIGNDEPDGAFAANVAAARAAGLRVGAYHVIYPLDHIDPAEQARRHWAASGGLGAAPGDLSAAADLEWPVQTKPGQPAGAEWRRWTVTAESIRAWALAYLAELARLQGRPPVVYSFPWHLSCLGLPNAGRDLAQYPLWLAADYGKFGTAGPPDGYTPRPPAPWWPATLEQWDGDGGRRMPNGVDADFNAFLGDQAAWEAFLNLPTAEQSQEGAPGDGGGEVIG